MTLLLSTNASNFGMASKGQPIDSVYDFNFVSNHVFILYRFRDINVCLAYAAEKSFNSVTTVKNSPCMISHSSVIASLVINIRCVKFSQIYDFER